MIDPAAHIGAVHLTVADLDRSVRFYEAHLGFSMRRRDDRTAWIGAGGRDLVVLTECDKAPRTTASARRCISPTRSNGIEIYRDRPRSEWPFVNGRLQMGADPLDFDRLLAEQGSDRGARIAMAP